MENLLESFIWSRIQEAIVIKRISDLNLETPSGSTFRPGLVSIVTPVYNAADFLAETIESVLAQTYTHFEYILVNDCSTDASPSLLADFAQADSRIHIIDLPENSGAAVARNRGIEAASGQYIAFVDSDDVWLVDKLSKQVRFMEEYGYAFTYTNFAQVSQEGDMLKKSVDLPKTLAYEDLLKNTAIACSTVMIDRFQTGDFRMPLVRKGQDTATWLMLMRTRKIQAHGLDQVLNRYRKVEGSISSNKFGALRRTWYTYYHLEELPFFKAAYYFVWYVINAILRRI